MRKCVTRLFGILFLGLAVVLPCRVSAAEFADFQKVEYLMDTISQKQGDYIRLLGGSVWMVGSERLGLPNHALPMSEVIITFQPYVWPNGKSTILSIAYFDNEDAAVVHVSGRFVTEPGYLTTVREKLANGSILKLSDGSLVSVSNLDQYPTRFWLPPYQVLLSKDKTRLWNLEEGEQIAIQPMEAIANDTPSGPAKLMLFGGRSHDVYLGCLSCSEYETDSVHNSMSKYGNSYSSESIFNHFGSYGSQFSSYSACNTFASDPPVIVDQYGKYYGRLTLKETESVRDNVRAWLSTLCNDD